MVCHHCRCSRCAVAGYLVLCLGAGAVFGWCSQNGQQAAALFVS